MRGPGATDARNQALLQKQDLVIAAWLGLLLPLAWLAPARMWSPASGSLTSVVERLTPRGTAARIDSTRRRCGDRTDLPAPSEIVARTMARRVERHLHYLRELRPGGWHPRITLTGGGNIDRALEQERGCILWVAPMLFSHLVTKKGLHEAGYAVTHLSHANHGVSQSRLGYRLNVVTTRPEERYLAERLVMTDGDELRRTRQLYDRLGENALVSIMAATEFGARMVTCPFLCGEVRLPTGAPSLSLATDATLLPVLALRHDDDRFEVIVEPPLTATPGDDRHAVVDDLVQQYVRRVEIHVIRHPEQYTEWW